MVTKTVLRVSICCDKGKTILLKAVCGLEGVNKVEVDSEKGTLTVIGEADPCDITIAARKACKCGAEIQTVGPPAKPEDPKPDPKKCPICGSTSCSGFCLIYTPAPCPCPGLSYCSGCMVCKPVALMTLDYGYGDPNPPCSIM